MSYMVIRNKGANLRQTSLCYIFAHLKKNKKLYFQPITVKLRYFIVICKIFYVEMLCPTLAGLLVFFVCFF